MNPELTISDLNMHAEDCLRIPVCPDKYETVVTEITQDDLSDMQKRFAKTFS